MLDSTKLHQFANAEISQEGVITVEVPRGFQLRNSFPGDQLTEFGLLEHTSTNCFMR